MKVWIDFSGTAPKGETLVRAGVEGVIGYIGLGRESKQIHRPVHDDYVKHGLRIGLVAELGIDDAWAALNDYETGKARAEIALADMKNDCPTAEFICCAADAHASSANQINDAVKYAQGFSAVLGEDFTGFYGFRETSVAVHNSGCCRVHWRCGSEPSLEDKKWVNFWQRNVNNIGRPANGIFDGTKVDFDEVIKELTVALTDADVQKVADAVLGRLVDDQILDPPLSIQNHIRATRADAYNADIQTRGLNSKLDEAISLLRGLTG